MINVQKGLELYRKVCGFAVVVQHYCHDRKLNVSLVGNMFDSRLKDVYVDRIEYDGNDFDIDISNEDVLICVSFDNSFVPSPIFEIAIMDDDMDTLGGWAEYDTRTGKLNFPFMSSVEKQPVVNKEKLIRVWCQLDNWFGLVDDKLVNADDISKAEIKKLYRQCTDLDNMRTLIQQAFGFDYHDKFVKYIETLDIVKWDKDTCKWSLKVK